MSDGYPDISKLRVVDLKQLCTEYGLDTKGKKADLQAKLLSYFDANPLSAATDEPQSEEAAEPVAEENEPVAQEPEPVVEQGTQASLLFLVLICFRASTGAGCGART